MRIPQEQLDRKIKVPKTLSVLKNITGTKDVQARLQNPTIKEAQEVLKSLDKKSRVYKFLSDEIKSQIPKPPAKVDSLEIVIPSVTEVKSSLDKLDETVSNLVFPEPLKEVEITNFPVIKDIKFPDFPKSFKVSNLPKPLKFPKSIRVSNFPEGLDLAPMVNTLQDSHKSLLEGLQGLTKGIWGDEAVRGVHILDSKGNIIDDFAPRVTVSGGGGGGGGASIPRNIRDGSKTVTTAGTRVSLDNDADTAKRVDVQAPKSNTGTIYVGAGTVVAAAGSERGIGLEPGDVYAFDTTSPNQIFLDSTVDGEGVTYNIHS